MACDAACARQEAAARDATEHEHCGNKAGIHGALSVRHASCACQQMCDTRVLRLQMCPTTGGLPLPAAFRSLGCNRVDQFLMRSTLEIFDAMAALLSFLQLLTRRTGCTKLCLSGSFLPGLARGQHQSHVLSEGEFGIATRSLTRLGGEASDSEYGSQSHCCHV